MLLLLLLAVVGGLVLLTVSADQFVIGAARLSVALRVSAVLVGVVVIGFGTSAPEMLVSALSAAQGELDLAVGNIIGSNAANLSLVLGVAALIAPMHVASTTLKREAPLSVASVVIVALVVQGGISRLQGVLLLLGMVAALTWIVRSARGGGAEELGAEVDEVVGHDSDSVRLSREAVRTLLGLVGTVGGAQLLLQGALGIAEEIGLAEGFVGLTLVALGTSLPELVTSIQAARKGEHDLIAGNLLGSNLFNSFAVGGIAGVLGPGPLNDPDIAGLGSVLMVVLALAAWAFMGTGRTVHRWEGGVLVAAYVVAVPLLAA